MTQGGNHCLRARWETHTSFCALPVMSMGSLTLGFAILSTIIFGRSFVLFLLTKWRGTHRPWLLLCLPENSDLHFSTFPLNCGS